jgi:hypothetical protein
MSTMMWLIRHASLNSNNDSSGLIGSVQAEIPIIKPAEVKINELKSIAKLKNQTLNNVTSIKNLSAKLELHFKGNKLRLSTKEKGILIQMLKKLNINRYKTKVRILANSLSTKNDSIAKSQTIKLRTHEIARLILPYISNVTITLQDKSSIDINTILVEIVN